MNRHEPQLRRIGAQHFRGTHGHVLVARSVESVAADPVLEIERPRQCVDERVLGQMRMKRRVEHGDVRNVRPLRPRRAYPSEARRIVQRSEHRALLDECLDAGVDSHGSRRAIAAMNDAVTDRGEPYGCARARSAQSRAAASRSHDGERASGTSDAMLCVLPMLPVDAINIALVLALAFFVGPQRESIDSGVWRSNDVSSDRARELRARVDRDA
jgi:hypothetical protein